MLQSRRFNVEKLIRSLNPVMFGIDLHWLPHAQGSLAVAGIIKKHHPDMPVVFGGLSASYYHRELLDYPQVDFVIRGDSAEEPLRQLIERVKQGQPVDNVPNLTWRTADGKVQANKLDHIKADLNDLSYDYRYIIKSIIRHRDMTGHLPFRRWLKYPIVALLPFKGCAHNCITCGGSNRFFSRTLGRTRVGRRDPGLIARDLRQISRYLKGPIIILDDIRQGGPEYVDTFLAEVGKIRIKNPIALELFGPADRGFLERISRAISNFNIQISPESQEETVRKAFGRHYSNQELEQTIEAALAAGCQRVDLFFMTGLPQQTRESVKDLAGYWQYLFSRFTRDKPERFQIYVSPLAPFLDPGSLAFENPEKYGYRLLYRSLKEHCQALEAPSWKYMLNYETQWMNRDQIVESTYRAAESLNQLNARFGIISQKEADRISARIKRARKYIKIIDDTITPGRQQEQAAHLAEIRTELARANHETLCPENEMEWPVKVSGFKLTGLLKAALAKQ
jgi:B12-binding domain/radical SAM domain protein